MKCLGHRTINLNTKFPLHVWWKSHLKLFKHKSNFLIFQLSHKERVGCVCRSKEEMGETCCARPQVWSFPNLVASLRTSGARAVCRAVGPRLAGVFQLTHCGIFKREIRVGQSKQKFIFFHLEIIFIFLKLSDFFHTTKFLYAFDSHKLFGSCCKNVSCLYNVHSFVKNWNTNNEKENNGVDSHWW